MKVWTCITFILKCIGNKIVCVRVKWNKINYDTDFMMTFRCINTVEALLAGSKLDQFLLPTNKQDELRTKTFWDVRTRD